MFTLLVSSARIGSNMGRVDDYLKQCRVRSFVEAVTGQSPQVPPSPEELYALLDYLRKSVQATIVGSAAAFYHLGGDPTAFRPTVDVDIHVNGPLPPPPPGWQRDKAAAGIESWISPTGGYVDFLVAGEELPGGVTVPTTVRTDKEADLPIATVADVFAMKLNSMREKDLFDAIALARRFGVPKIKGMNPQQKDNWQLVKLWIDARPTGKYGE